MLLHRVRVVEGLAFDLFSAFSMHISTDTDVNTPQLNPEKSAMKIILDKSFAASLTQRICLYFFAISAIRRLSSQSKIASKEFSGIT